MKLYNGCWLSMRKSLHCINQRYRIRFSVFQITYFRVSSMLDISGTESLNEEIKTLSILLEVLHKLY